MFSHKETSYRLYSILGISKSASREEIRKSYIKLARKEHPDKGGNEEHFKDINKAYEVLYDINKRKIYDETGDENIENKPSIRRTNPFDIFNSVFNFNFSTSRQRETKHLKMKDFTYKLGVTLRELYCGVTKCLSLELNKVCLDCKGTGSKNGLKNICSICQGKKFIFNVKRQGNTVIRSSKICSVCSGKGEIINKENNCSICHGQGNNMTKIQIKIIIKEGSYWSEVLQYNDVIYPDAINKKAGNLIIILERKEGVDFISDKFTLNKLDLIIKKELPLVDSLCGGKFIIDHLDGEKYLISTKGLIIHPGSKHLVKGLGMKKEEKLLGI